MKDRTIVKAGEEKNMAVQSPRGILVLRGHGMTQDSETKKPGNRLKYGKE